MPVDALVYVHVNAEPAAPVIARLVARAAGRGHTVRTVIWDTGPASQPLNTRPGWAKKAEPAIEASEVDVVIVRSVGELAAAQCDRAAVQGWLGLHGVRIEAQEPTSWEIDAWLSMGSGPRSVAAPAHRRRTPHQPGGGGWSTEPTDMPVLDEREALVRSMQTAFPADLMAIPAARHLLNRWLTDWGLEQVADGAITAANELLANAVKHGCTSGDDTVTMAVQCTAQELRILVEDPSPSSPQPRAAMAEAESGRGLALVDAFTDRWGVTPTQGKAGKTVWIALDLPGVPSHGRASVA